MTIILASESPRRKELLTRVVSEFQVFPAQIDETFQMEETPLAYVERMAQQKAQSVSKHHMNDLVIGCDTIVVIEGKILGKPVSQKEAQEMLQRLSGRTHEVYTSICLQQNQKKQQETIVSSVTFYDLSSDEILDYLKTKEYKDKAGAYGIQGAGALMIQSIQGDYYAIMGLPIAILSRMLKNNEYCFFERGKKDEMF